MSLQVNIVGGDRIKATLEKMAAGIDPNLRKALDKAGDKIRDEAQAICPVGTPESTGNPRYIASHALQRSIRKLPITDKSGVIIVGIRAGGYIVNPNSGRVVDYAIPVEFGSSRQAPQGFMRPALLQNRTAIMEIIQASMRDNIKEARE